VGRFLRGRPSSALASAQSSRRSRPAPSVSSGRCHVGPGASQTPPISLSTLRVETVSRPTRYGTRYPPKPVPFLCSDRFPHRCDSGQTATRASGQGCLMPPCRIPTLSATNCGLSHPIVMPRPPPSPPPPLRCVAQPPARPFCHVAPQHSLPLQRGADSHLTPKCAASHRVMAVATVPKSPSSRACEHAYSAATPSRHLPLFLLTQAALLLRNAWL
jgi:hypothetical protein